MPAFACPVPSSISISIFYSIIWRIYHLRPLAVVYRPVKLLHSTVLTLSSSGPSGPPHPAVALSSAPSFGLPRSTVSTFTHLGPSGPPGAATALLSLSLIFEDSYKPCVNRVAISIATAASM